MAARPRAAAGANAALWRYTGALGRAWRLYGASAPPALRAQHARLLLACRDVLLPHVSQGSEGQDLLALLATLAGKSANPTTAAATAAAATTAAATVATAFVAEHPAENVSSPSESPCVPTAPAAPEEHAHTVTIVAASLSSRVPAASHVQRWWRLRCRRSQLRAEQQRKGGSEVSEEDAAAPTGHWRLGNPPCAPAATLASPAIPGSGWGQAVSTARTQLRALDELQALLAKDVATLDAVAREAAMDQCVSSTTAVVGANNGLFSKLSPDGKVVAYAIWDFLDSHPKHHDRGASYSEVQSALSSHGDDLVKNVFRYLVAEGYVLEHEGLYIWL